MMDCQNVIMLCISFEESRIPITQVASQTVVSKIRPKKLNKKPQLFLFRCTGKKRWRVEHLEYVSIVFKFSHTLSKSMSILFYNDEL